MALIKLTQNRYVDSNIVAEVEFRPDPETPIFELAYKPHAHSAGFRFFGEEAKEAWDNWRSYADTL